MEFNKKSIISILVLLLSIFSCSIAENGNNGGSNNDNGTEVPNGSFVIKGEVDSTTANYVYAINPNNMEKRICSINNKQFTLGLEKGKAWVVAVIDSTKTGQNMIEGVFSANTLDSVSPMSGTGYSSSDLGELNVSGGTAKLSNTYYNTLIERLGMSSNEADRFGGIDQYMKFCINPDINNNGVIDCDEVDHPDYKIIFWHHYDYGNAAAMLANLSNIQNGNDVTFDESIEFENAVFQIQAENESFFTDRPKFEFELYNTTGTLIQNSGVIDNWGGSGGYSEYYYDYEFNLTNGRMSGNQIPEGTYKYNFYASDGTTTMGSFTFTNVQTMGDVDDPVNFVLPFPKVNVDGDGEVTLVDYKWMRYDADNDEFVDATSADIEFFLGNNNAEIKWYTDDGASAPTSSAYKSIKPKDDNFNTTGSFDADQIYWKANTSRKRADIQHVTVSSISKLGLWVKFTIATDGGNY